MIKSGPGYLFTLIVIILAAFFVQYKFFPQTLPKAENELGPGELGFSPGGGRVAAAGAVPKSKNKFQCAAKSSCSEMTSCEEVLFYLHYCPQIKLDGGDGRFCRQQWCGDK